jgi:2-oxoglutarate dehydrogenase E1 component
MYRQFVANPESVSASWRDFFEDYSPRGNGGASASSAPAAPAPVAEPAPPPLPAPTSPPPSTSPVPTGIESGDSAAPLRGAAARVVQNMETSLGVPTATSVRTVPAKLLEVNRQILNNHLNRVGRGKVSFTHLIAFAVVKAIAQVPTMNSGFEVREGVPSVVHHEHVNLGLAVDLTKPDGSRTLLVPNIKRADTLDFVDFFLAYEELIRKVRSNKLSPDDFAGTTGTITNPGMIGTVHSVPRLMQGQGFIVGVGSIAYPSEYEGADPHTIARIGLSKVFTLTSTYDHRIIQGAESGEFLRQVHSLLVGEDEFYDEIFHSFRVPYEPARWSTDLTTIDDAEAAQQKIVHVQALVNMYRVRGHLIANLDPLGRHDVQTHPELDLSHYGLSIWDLDREFPIGTLGGGNLARTTMPLRDILGVLRDAYSRTVGVEYMHIQDPDQKEWIQDRVEAPVPAPSKDVQHRILDRLNAAEAFEAFLQTRYLGQKRFSLEGAESLIPMLDALLSAAADDDMSEAVLGMAHRGRLNVLVNVVGKSYEQIFREFDGGLDPASVEGSGDVKYHLGYAGKHLAPSGRQITLTLASNPSHLEAVDPVVEGMARALGDRLGDLGDRGMVLPVLVHGDAAFAGQGVVAETLNLSEVPGYEVGGTVHIVVNNQLGFTTAPELGRSSVYATDVAKMVQAPIFHVNGDDPEACIRVVELAFAFRQEFRKDVVVDMVCYRRFGHNELDEPAFTQPKMYELIREHRSVRKLYTETLVNRGDLSLEDAEAALQDFRDRMDSAFGETHLSSPPESKNAVIEEEIEPAPVTRVAREELERVVTALVTWPGDFHVSPKLERILMGRRTEFDADRIDWALGEALAFGTMVLEGTPVRVAGQDTRRGTFSQRHGVLVDAENESEYAPLAHISDDQARFMLYDTVLSEYAALGFEYGYSISDPDAFVAWEAQFGDFMNAAQVIIDQFIVAAEDKWGQTSRLALLLPHGFEGQGPEHSSARIERFLVSAAENNMRIVYPTTAAQYFHVLRRQVKSPLSKPLVCFTPKRYLRMAATRSSVAELTDGAFHETLGDPSPALDKSAVSRVLLCTGKLAHELIERRDELNAPVAAVRVEQLYPWPEEQIARILDGYPNARQVWWVQEEPSNVGAWPFVHVRLHKVLRDRDLRHIARAPSPSPASGSATVHEGEQQELLAAAFEGFSS